MPIYEYACASCGHHLEVMQSIKDAPLKQCPECKRRTLKKMVSATGFVLKGSGWYVTDFRDKHKPRKEEGKAGKESAADRGETPSREEKPAEKPRMAEKKKKSAKAG